eukprot:CAMPEP_0204618974 /NCGR_PEP_ID=MMETSP0717-20131115/5466_1 /ASSEMBLY_ACC=CAM_ASM_000666 /TAXON_ID=230516 /ORGANISM="Chaetoceros curvisetus" /LENGTH=388 /DNA_ID=CAMNT_0051632845 /DNA_START=123 /DNA_END=1289 /DNA_ORIENTATION=+
MSPKGGGHLVPPSRNVGAPRRRNNPQEEAASLETHFFSTKFDPPPPTPQPEMSKKRAQNMTSVMRSTFHKISAPFLYAKDVITPAFSARPNHSANNGKEYYQDNFNDLSYRCSCGTHQDDGIWLNHGDTPGLIMSSLVWLMIMYSGITVTLLANHNSLAPAISTTYCTIAALAVTCHAKTMLTDPGGIPLHAVPTEEDGANRVEFPMCSVCGTYKPPKTHHCRICNRCIAGMDHHCPWMNNCVGIGNLKHFMLFLIYVWVASAYALITFGLNYFLCETEECVFPDGLVHLVRIMTCLCIGAMLFVSNMIVAMFWGIMTGMGTIDRMKKHELGTFDQSIEEPMPWTDVFGIGAYWTWLLPMDPLFDDHDRVTGYATAHRLLREKNMSMI